MGGRRVAAAESPATPRRAAPVATVRDGGGLWSFELHATPGTDIVVVLLPAMGVPARYYTWLVTELLDEGIGVAAVDFLAERVARDPSRTRDGFAVLVEECIPAVLDTVTELVPAARPVIVGHSLGGQLGLIAAARYAPTTPVVLAASGTAWHKAFPGSRRWLYLIGSQTIRGVARMLGYWPGDRLGFGGRQPQAIIRDWSHLVRTGQYKARTGSFDYDTALTDYEVDILAIDVTHDILAPQAATDALLAKAPNARVHRRSYNAARGTSSPGAHFTWVRDRDGLATTITTWARLHTH